MALSKPIHINILSEDAYASDLRKSSPDEYLKKSRRNTGQRELDNLKILMSMNIRNIPNVLKYDSERGILYLKRIKGKDFFAIISSSHLRTDCSKLLEIFLGVLKVVKQVHDEGYVHLDLKPENIMIENGGSRYFPQFDSSLEFEFDRRVFLIDWESLEGTGFKIKELITGFLEIHY